MNNVTLTGRLTRKAEVRYGGQDNSTAIARFTLAVDDRQDTDFIACKALGKLGEWVEKWTDKGTKIELTGKIKTGSYDKDGTKVYYQEVLATQLSFGESKAEAQSRANGSGAQQQQDTDASGFMNIPDGLDDELPFN